MRVIGAIAMRLGTVRPLIRAGRERMSAAREAVSGAVTVTWCSSGDTGRYVHMHGTYCTGQPAGPHGHSARLHDRT
ncbi:hypothetical protein GCM10010145_01070 [Streptomyces ruber]|uniref:Uncharacterized protein n=2 Tax=Streptomyces TaxID=1883 RepID=A0A918B8F3_9ACTN|nr:hypothetical protein GCM10010145_01070 [Streptomyces ruber]